MNTPDPIVTEIAVLSAHIAAALSAHRMDPRATASDPELFRMWDSAQPETRAAALLSFAWETRAGTLPVLDGAAWLYAVELHEGARAHSGELGEFLGAHWPAMPLPGPVGALASSLGFDRDDTDVSLLTLVLLILAGHEPTPQGASVAQEAKAFGPGDGTAFTLTPAQLTTLRFAVHRVYAEFLEHAHDSAARHEPESFDTGIISAFADLCEVFDIETPVVHE